jgi:hypothetical protein
MNKTDKYHFIIEINMLYLYIPDRYMICGHYDALNLISLHI